MPRRSSATRCKATGISSPRIPNDPMAKRVRAIVAARREAIIWRRTLDRHAAGLLVLSAAISARPACCRCAAPSRHLSAALEPPPTFAPVDYDVPPPPPPEEIVYVSRPVLYFSDPVFAFAPPPPPPVFYLCRRRPPSLSCWRRRLRRRSLRVADAVLRRDAGLRRCAALCRAAAEQHHLRQHPQHHGHQHRHQPAAGSVAGRQCRRSRSHCSEWTRGARRG